ncbi:unnamed protein product [Anisakis simplex]|uniref:Uncharacterized protein n=1 Tax=Anisakis simplex TaxID=6269 RepID=A0A3P6NI44_ANISI|nr:unnamed protein product [Anisakis simplex]
MVDGNGDRITIPQEITPPPAGATEQPTVETSSGAPEAKLLPASTVTVLESIDTEAHAQPKEFPAEPLSPKDASSSMDGVAEHSKLATSLPETSQSTGIETETTGVSPTEAPTTASAYTGLQSSFLIRRSLPSQPLYPLKALNSWQRRPVAAALVALDSMKLSRLGLALSKFPCWKPQRDVNL